MFKNDPVLVAKRICTVESIIEQRIEEEKDAEEIIDLKSDLKIITSLPKIMDDYVRSVYQYEDTRSEYFKSIHESISIEEFQYNIEVIDAYRKTCLDILISAVANADRRCELYDCEKIYGEFGIFESNVAEIKDIDKYLKNEIVDARNNLADWAYEYKIYSELYEEVPMDIIEQSNEDIKCSKIVKKAYLAKQIECDNDPLCEKYKVQYSY